MLERVTHALENTGQGRFIEVTRLVGESWILRDEVNAFTALVDARLRGSDG